MILQSLSGCVARAFRKFEHAVESLTGVVGPLFVGTAVVLLAAGLWSYVEIVFPRFFSSYKLLGALYSIYIVCMVLAMYYYSCTEPPGMTVPIEPSVPNSVSAHGKKCLKCSRLYGNTYPKPERAHHCRVCKRCILKYDHHCPWVNQCIGNGNERYFVLFLCYMSVAMISFALFSYKPFMDSLFVDYFPYHTPRVVFIIIFLLCAILGVAVGVLGAQQLYYIARGETPVESSDNAYYKARARANSTSFQNPYDMGAVRNFAIFFNVDEYSLLLVFLPVRVPPASDGWSWPTAVPYDPQLQNLTDEEEPDPNEVFEM